MKTSPADRRVEARLPVRGEVRLRQTGVITGPFVGRLLDLSTSGFRACHSRLTLASGDRVDFEFEGRSGVARAVWNRIMDREVETGFCVVAETD
jgi:hypothetical protein